MLTYKVPKPPAGTPCGLRYNKKRLYIIGGIGSGEYGEAFTFDYDLPNDTVYAETCATIGLVFFARRMLKLEKPGKYADVTEQALY